jgi:hypothetical protein
VALNVVEMFQMAFQVMVVDMNMDYNLMFDYHLVMEYLFLLIQFYHQLFLNLLVKQFLLMFQFD